MTKSATHVRLYPKPGLQVRAPSGQPVPTDGVQAPLPLSSYWRRRVADGSVTDKKPAAPSAKAPATKQTEE